MTITDPTRSGRVQESRGRVLVRQPSRAELDPERTHRRRRLLETTLAIGFPLALLLLWQVASALDWIDGRLYPAPTEIAERGWDLLREGRLWDDLFATSRRVLLGWGIGTVAGVVLGVLMGSSTLLRRAMEPTLDALYVVPKLALLPILFNIFGLGEGSQVALVAVTVFFFVWIAAMAAIMAVPEGYRDGGHVFGAGRWQMFRHVVFPAALPQMLVGARVAAGVAVLVIVAAEFLVGENGLGYLIFSSRNLFINDAMFVGIVVVALLGVLLAQLLRMLERVLVPWGEHDKGGSGR